jgi:alpha-tubulin suppressor-like RCC1 family protein
MKKLIITILVLCISSYLNAQCWLQVCNNQPYGIGLQKDSTMWMWGGGDPTYLNYGDSSKIDKLNLIIVHPGKWNFIETFNGHSFAIKNDGTLWFWGSNTNFPSGLGGAAYYYISKVNNDTDWKSVQTGDFNTIAIKNNGSIWSCGTDYKGNLGLGVAHNTIQIGFKQIGTDSNWWKIDNANVTYAIKKDSSLWGCGSNALYSLGDSTNIDRNTLVPIGTDKDWIEVSGADLKLGLKANGTLWAWGTNYNYINSLVTILHYPVQVGTDTDWKFINASGETKFAIKNDGSLWATGRNDIGQLGDGTIIDKTNFIQIGSGIKWKMVTQGRFTTHAITETAELYAWGENAGGQLGVGYKSAYSSVPIMVGNFCAPLGIANTPNVHNSFEVYPNPANEVLIIKVAQVSTAPITLLNIYGQSILSQYLDASNKDLKIVVGSLPRGVYFVKYGNESRKVVLE